MITTLLRICRGVVTMYVFRQAGKLTIATTGTVAAVACGAGAWWLVPGASLAWVAPPVASATSLVVLSCFPDIVRAIHRSGTTLTDIENRLVAPTDQRTAKTRKVLYTMFTCALVLTTAVSLGLIMDYVFIFNGGASQLTSVESLGIIGGMLSLAKRLQRKIGAGLIVVHSAAERFMYIWGINSKPGDDNGTDDAVKDAANEVKEAVDAIIEIV